MPVTQATFEAFLHCETKSYLKFNGVVGVPSEFGQSQAHLREEYRRACREQFCNAVPNGRWHTGTLDLQSLENRRYQLILDYMVALPDIGARLDALKSCAASNGLGCTYVPIRFVSGEKLSTYDKLLLAFDAFAFSQVCGKTPHVGRIIHGCHHTTITVRLTDMIGRVSLLLRRIAEQQANTAPPPLALNKHCAECEFQSHCRKVAIQKDDLSLLSTLSKKERERQNARGIFTLTQLSYTSGFRGAQHLHCQGISPRSRLSPFGRIRFTFSAPRPSACLERLCILTLKAPRNFLGSLVEGSRMGRSTTICSASIRTV